MKEIKLLVAGGREYVDEQLLIDVLNRLRKWYNVVEIIVGGARGADEFGKQYAIDNSIPYRVFPAKWEEHGRGAGYIRNAEMWKAADVGILFWNGLSKGTAHSLDLAVKADKTLFVCNYVDDDFYIHHLRQETA